VKNATPQVQSNEAAQQVKDTLQKSYMFVSTKHVDYNNLSAFESASMSLVMVLAVLIGVLQATSIA